MSTQVKFQVYQERAKKSLAKPVKLSFLDGVTRVFTSIRVVASIAGQRVTG